MTRIKIGAAMGVKPSEFRLTDIAKKMDIL
jgi:uncharacterized protein YneF (UPF0154 family)